MQRKNFLIFQSASAWVIVVGVLALCSLAESAEVPHVANPQPASASKGVTRSPTSEEAMNTVPMEPGLNGSNTPSDTESTSNASEGEKADQAESFPDHAGAVSGGTGNSSVTTEVAETQPGVAGTISVNYFALLFGPGIQDPTSDQPTIYGKPDTNNPILVKNYLGAGYNITNDIAITPTAYWAYQPVQGQSLTLEDPYLMVSDANLYRNDYGTSWYGDVRFHVPASTASHAAKFQGGIQTFHYVSQEIQGTRFTFGTSASARGNFYGQAGYGTDIELYAAPNVSYQITPTLSALVRYELNASHNYGDPFSHFNNDGTDIEPGVIWNVTNNLMVNPYLNLTPGGSISLSSTSIGAYLNWTLI